MAVRNPLDAFYSFFNMIVTQTHTKSFSNNLDDLKKYWDPFFESDVLSWAKWHAYWIDIAKQKKVPIYFFRFEDLLLNPEPVLKDMFKYILLEENIDKSVIEKRIQDVINTGKNFLYKPRSAGGGFHKHTQKISQEQMQFLMEHLEPYLHFFGYAKDERVVSTS